MAEGNSHLEWAKLKQKLDTIGRTPKIIEGEVWWCACGKNIGIEINGKNEVFSRPVLIMKKMSELGFMGIPLTSQRKTGSWYIEVQVLRHCSYVAICQARVMSVSRLYSKMEKISKDDLARVRRAFVKFYG